jgi:hypothetical protein
MGNKQIQIRFFLPSCHVVLQSGQARTCLNDQAAARTIAIAAEGPVPRAGLDGWTLLRPRTGAPRVRRRIFPAPLFLATHSGQVGVAVRGCVRAASAAFANGNARLEFSARIGGPREGSPACLHSRKQRTSRAPRQRTTGSMEMARLRGPGRFIHGRAMARGSVRRCSGL